ncbi:MAG: ABC transporter substrate-binding protein [Rhodospirillales bacterium]|jgi:peptide/nickel transport system substrate-binding protein
MTQSVRRLIYLIAALCVAGFMLAACGDDNGTSKSADMYQQSDTLRVGVMGLPPMLGNPYASLNAPTIYTWSAIFDGLTYVGNDSVVQPWLATSWEATSPTTWVFKLREGVTFSNGEPFNSNAVINAVEYLTSPEALTEVVAQMLSSMTGARAIDKYTVEITTAVPNVIFPREAASLRMVAPEHWQRLGPQGFAQEPHGTGPFRVVAWEPAVARMEAFEGSWRPPHFKKLEVYAVPEGPQRIQGIISDRLDVVLGTIPDQMEALEAAGHQWVSIPGGGIYTFSMILNRDHPAFGPDNEPLMDVRVRRALNYAIDRQAYIEVLLSNTTRAPSQPVPSTVFGYNPDLEPYPYDPDLARALLAEAGYPEGFDLIFEVVPGTSVPNGVAIYQKIAEDLRAVGVNLELKTFPLPQYFNAVHTGEFKGQGFMMDFPTAPQLDALRGMRLHSCLWKTPWLCNEDDQAMITAAMAEPILARREALTQDIMRRYHEQAYLIYLFERVDYYGVRGSLEGFEAEGLFIQYDKIKWSNK